MLVELVGATYNFLTGALSNSKTKQMVDAKWRSIALTINSLGHGAPFSVDKVKKKWFDIYLFSLFNCIFILLSRESDQCAIRARLGVTGHLSTTPRWGNPAKCLSQRHNK